MSHNGDIVDFDNKKNGGVRVCTAATKPSSPFEGQVIYVTDNDAGEELEAYDGSSWQTIGVGDITGIDGTTFTLNEDHTGAPSANCAFKVERGTSGDARMVWNEIDDRWEFDDDDIHVPIKCSRVETSDGIYFDGSTGDYKIAENDGTGDLEITVPTGKSIVFKAV